VKVVSYDVLIQRSLAPGRRLRKSDATPTDAAGVEEHLLERLSDEQTKQLATIWRAVLRP
jgi:hypothetical protein